MGHPTIYPTGVTLYNPAKAWNGYTIFPAGDLGALLIDMNGKEVQLWKGLQGFPNKLLPNGQVFGSTGLRAPDHGFQDQIDLVQVDWEGNIVWRFSRLEHIADPGQDPRWYARQHHDFQREGNPVGYYVPGQTPANDRGKTLLLVHADVHNPKISDQTLLDDKLIEVNWEGEILWSWSTHEHFDELGFDDAAKAILFRDPGLRKLAAGSVGDWLHVNSASFIGPNRHFDAGDHRFHPDNIIWDSREANIIAITDRKTGNISWRLGPNYDGSEAERKLGWIIGQHHAHIIPRGLPGDGNLLVFDNGGWAGYGKPNPASPTGRMNARRDYSRVLEIDPISLQIVWQYTPAEAGFLIPLDASRFYSPFVSSAQRLPNGNTLITEGSDGRIFEVTGDHELVWEYISPYWGNRRLALAASLNMVYRAYRAPYSWVPQREAPTERPVLPLEKSRFRVPGAAPLGREREISVPGIRADQQDAAFCVAPSGTGP